MHGRDSVTGLECENGINKPAALMMKVSMTTPMLTRGTGGFADRGGEKTKDSGITEGNYMRY